MSHLVYIVIEHDPDEGSCVRAVYVSEADAEGEIALLKLIDRVAGRTWEVEEWNAQ